MMMETTRFGKVDVDPDRVIKVERGLYGFPEARRFVLFEYEPNGPFQWLQSLEDPALAFLVVNPHLFFPTYEMVITDEEALALGIRDADEAQVLTMVTVRYEPREVTANLVGPLVIGVNSRQAAQLVLNGDRYTTRHPLPMMRTTSESVSDSTEPLHSVA